MKQWISYLELLHALFSSSRETLMPLIFYKNFHFSKKKNSSAFIGFQHSRLNSIIILYSFQWDAILHCDCSFTHLACCDLCMGKLLFLIKGGGVGNDVIGESTRLIAKEIVHKRDEWKKIVNKIWKEIIRHFFLFHWKNERVKGWWKRWKRLNKWCEVVCTESWNLISYEGIPSINYIGLENLLVIIY